MLSTHHLHGKKLLWISEWFFLAHEQAMTNIDTVILANIPFCLGISVIVTLADIVFKPPYQ
jgi:hypothetical protein